MPDVIELADRFHDALEKQDAKALERIVRAYAGIQARLQGEIDALALELERDGLTVAQAKRLDRYKRILAQTADEVEKFTRFMDVELSSMGREYVARGLAESRALMTAAVNGEPALVSRFRDLPPEAVERLLGFLDPQGPLYRRLALLPGFVADKVSQTIIDSVALGRNPRVLAREMTRAFGMGLTDSLRMARTVQLYSYREASRANYIANNEIVQGWTWYAALDSLTCPACVALHGTLHELDEKLSGHHNCRCTPIPVTILSPNGHGIQPGEEWLKSQPESVQRSILGKGAFEEYRRGGFALADVVKSHNDEVYGEMFTAKSLKELTGTK